MLELCLKYKAFEIISAVSKKLNNFGQNPQFSFSLNKNSIVFVTSLPNGLRSSSWLSYEKFSLKF